MKNKLCLIIVTVLMLVVFAGCANIMGKLRKDLDDTPVYDAPTVGGAWPEGSLLDENKLKERYDIIGHSERSPASMNYNKDVLGGMNNSWVSDQQAASNLRDQYREGSLESRAGAVVNYSDNPNLPPQVKRLYKNGQRTTRDDFIDDSQNEGSLWSSTGQTNYFLTKNRTRAVGDLLTMTLSDTFVKDVAGEIKKTMSKDEFETELDDTQKRMIADADKNGKNKTRGPASAASATAKTEKKKDGEEEETPDIPNATYADIDLTKSIGLTKDDTVMMEITDRYPNGNYKLQGTKRVTYKGNTRVVNVLAIAKSTEVADNDTIEVGKLYEYRLKAYR